MKHSKKITLIILSMFIITQFIGLFVIDSNPFYHTQDNGNGTIEVANPYLPELEPLKQEAERGMAYIFFSLIIAFILSISIFLLLTRFNAEVILRIWFFVVVTFALFISFNAFIPKLLLLELFFLFFAISLAFIKVYKRNFLLHNLTEFFIYPGIASVFVPILRPVSIVIILILIS